MESQRNTYMDGWRLRGYKDTFKMTYSDRERNLHYNEDYHIRMIKI